MAACQVIRLFSRKEPYRRAFHYIQSKLIQTLVNLKNGLWLVKQGKTVMR